MHWAFWSSASPEGLVIYGRADEPTEWGASVLVLALQAVRLRRHASLPAPGAMADRGLSQYPPARSATPVRLPGEAALARARQARREGVPLSPAIAATMRTLAGALWGRSGGVGQ